MMLLLMAQGVRWLAEHSNAILGDMNLTRDEAWDLLCEWTETDSLRKHARSVEIVMRAAAERYGAGAEDVEAWGRRRDAA